MKKIILLVFIAAISFGKIEAQVNVGDSLALVDLYNNCNGRYWSPPRWNLSQPISTWNGIDLDGSKTRVRGIELVGNNLSGSIPSSIGNLSALTELWLNDNSITGSIPSTLGNLSELYELMLQDNNLTGVIPSSLGNLSNLYGLYLENNQLTGEIPSSLGNLSKAGVIELGYNQFSGIIPSTLGNISTLYSLNLNNNLLTGNIPSSLGNFSALDLLALNDNKLTGEIPSSLGNLSSLSTLDLHNNQLSGNIPATFGSTLASLQVLRFDNNQLSGSIPAALNNLYNIQDIFLGSNEFTFDGMEAIATTYPSEAFYVQYAPQAAIPLHYNKSTGVLSVSAGGTLSNNTYIWYCNGSMIASNVGDSAFTLTKPGSYFVSVTNSIVTALNLHSDTLNFDTSIMQDHPRILYANREFTGTDGWTNYYWDRNTPNDYTDDTLLLSLNKKGQNIGTIGDGTFSVKLQATAGAGSNTAILLTNPLITNPSGYWVMNRYWLVSPTTEPTSDVGVRFYYNNQDLNDVNGSYPTHNLTNQQLIFYKTIGGNPDPTTDLAGATAIISIMNASYASNTTWTYHQLTDTTQYAEFSIAGFSGGGGGGTGNDQSLPIKLLSFTASKQNTNVLVQWTTTQEVNANYYEVERSVDGVHFTDISRVNAKRSLSANHYSYTDNLSILNGEKSTVFYRLKMFDKDGSYSLSEIRNISFGSVFTTIVYPNPAKDKLNISITASKDETAQIQIVSTEGKILFSQNIHLSSGTSTQNINVSRLAKGDYFVNIKTDEGNVNEKFVKE